jgi:hypothetical protein
MLQPLLTNSVVNSAALEPSALLAPLSWVLGGMAQMAVVACGHNRSMLSEAVGTTLILPDMAAVIRNDSGQLVDQVRAICTYT